MFIPIILVNPNLVSWFARYKNYRKIKVSFWLSFRHRLRTQEKVHPFLQPATISPDISQQKVKVQLTVTLPGVWSIWQWRVSNCLEQLLVVVSHSKTVLLHSETKLMPIMKYTWFGKRSHCKACGNIGWFINFTVPFYWTVMGDIFRQLLNSSQNINSFTSNIICHNPKCMNAQEQSLNKQFWIIWLFRIPIEIASISICSLD